MRITVPHMGNLSVAFRGAFQQLGIEMVVPPPTTKRTLSLGARYSPESVCIPFKLTLGNFFEALELGADTLLMVSGPGLCRFGYYARLQEQILREQGFRFEMITTDLAEDKRRGAIQLVKRLSNDAPLPAIVAAVGFGLAKLAALDELERLVHRVRARELHQGTATAIFRGGIAAVDAAADRRALARAKDEHLAKLRAVEMDPDCDPLVVGVIGEFFVVLEPFSNLDIEVELGKLGVEVRRTTWLSDWLRVDLFRNPFRPSEEERLHRAARPYLRRDVGGDGWETVGEVVLHAGEYDGLVHLAPFGCMPEIVARNIIPTIGDRLPVLTLVCDEQMGHAGQVTRVEAFVDLLRRRRAKATASEAGAALAYRT